MARFVGSLTRHPARVSVAWYASVALIGTLLLTQPFCRRPEAAPITLVDSAFTAVSALCVTGLAVRSTGHDYSFIGQLVILALIQLGGIGIITVTTYVILRLGGRQSLHNRTLLADTIGAGNEPNLRMVLARVARVTLLFETVGVLLLTARFLFDHEPADALWHAVFHSVSAFCNAGFSLNDDSLMAYRGDWIVNLTVMALVICGGIGYPVLIDIARHRHGSWRDRWEQYMLHTKLMLFGTAVLLSVGTLAVLLLEGHGLLQGLPPSERLLVAMFQSVTCRTAGFNTVDIAQLTTATLFVFMLLMMIGAGPCSAAGGFKVSTLLVLILRAWASFRGRSRVSVARRTLPQPVIDRAIITALLFAVTSAGALTWLLVAEQTRTPPSQSDVTFHDAAFEVVSALGTVGLSTGITPGLTPVSKVIIIAMMFIGRLGPLTAAVAVSLAGRDISITYAKEEPLIG